MKKLVLLIFVAWGAARAQTDQSALRMRLIKQPLYLLSLWSSDDLHFDGDGKLIEQSEVTSIALSGIQIDKVDAKSDRLEIKGRRVGVEFAGANLERLILQKRVGKKKVDEPITITLDRPTSGNYEETLAKVFTQDFSALEPAAPTYWRSFFAQLAKRPVTPTVSVSVGKIYRIGGGVSEPLILSQPEPKFNEYARAMLYAGVVQVSFVVNKLGQPVLLDVVKPIGLGLDEVAVEAVRRYKFAPATYNGHSVPVELTVEVGFAIIP